MPIPVVVAIMVAIGSGSAVVVVVAVGQHTSGTRGEAVWRRVNRRRAGCRDPRIPGV